jgi:hypothetical protein
VLELREANSLALIVLLFAAQGCRSRITGTRPRKANSYVRFGQGIDWEAVHTAANICLFPPIFFFSGLYYTDVLSTCIVVGAYNHFLRKGGEQSGSFRRGLDTYLLGIMALFMRQTNIFWVAIFMGGLEAARSLKGRDLRSTTGKGKHGPGGIGDFIVNCQVGAFHDQTLAKAEVIGNSTLRKVSDTEESADVSRFLLVCYESCACGNNECRTHAYSSLATNCSFGVFRRICPLERWCCAR